MYVAHLDLLFFFLDLLSFRFPKKPPFRGYYLIWLRVQIFSYSIKPAFFLLK